jgi:hypothetical protein
MFGLGYQELLIILVIFTIFLFLNPVMMYVLSLLGLKTLRSPRRVVVAFWLLNILAVGFETSGDLRAMFATAVLIAPITIALALGQLWVCGWVWQRIGFSRLGGKWQAMAKLLFTAVKPRQPVAG